MILNELMLQNIGTFSGINTITLTPPSAETPIILFGGLNGAGKTTILESIQLALYGPLYHASSRRTGSYEKYLRSLIHRGSHENEGAAIELSFSAYQEGRERHYEVRRSWKNSSKLFREILVVSVDGKYDQALSSTWNEHVETFLPRGIAGLFFFDGEQIEALADLENSREVLGAALTTLLGLDMVDRLNTDLAVLKRRRNQVHIPEHLLAAVDKSKENMTALQQIENDSLEKAAFLKNKLEQAENQYREINEKYREAGGNLLEKRDETEKHAQLINDSLSQCESELRQELSEAAPLLQLEPLLLELLDVSRHEAEIKRNTLLINEITHRDDSILNGIKNIDLPSEYFEKIANIMSADRDRRRAKSLSKPVVNMENPDALSSLVEIILPQSKRRLSAILERKSKLKDELDQTERVIAAIPDSRAIETLAADRDNSYTLMIRAQAAFDIAIDSVSSAHKNAVKGVSRYEQMLEESTEARFASEDEIRLITHINKVQATLDVLRVTATTKHLDRISRLVLEALSMLLRKEQLITDIRIDPLDFTVCLTGSNGYDLPATDLSAGERQLLAVALLWGLARASGQPLPVVIDTPLGRLDGIHRSHLLERYFPRASHQVILLSTDEEIDSAAMEQIRQYVGRSYYLEFDQIKNSTRVENGYFWD